MSEFTQILNLADKLASYYRQGTMAAIVLHDWLVDHGFYGVVVDGKVTAYWNGVRFDLGNN